MAEWWYGHTMTVVCVGAVVITAWLLSAPTICCGVYSTTTSPTTHHPLPSPSHARSFPLTAPLTCLEHHLLPITHSVSAPMSSHVPTTPLISSTPLPPLFSLPVLSSFVAVRHGVVAVTRLLPRSSSHSPPRRRSLLRPLSTPLPTHPPFLHALPVTGPSHVLPPDRVLTWHAPLSLLPSPSISPSPSLLLSSPPVVVHTVCCSALCVCLSVRVHLRVSVCRCEYR